MGEKTAKVIAPVNVTTTYSFVNNSIEPVDIVATLRLFGRFGPPPLDPGLTASTTFTNTDPVGAAKGSSGGTVTPFGLPAVAIPATALVNGTNVTFTIVGNPTAVPPIPFAVTAAAAAPPAPKAAPAGAPAAAPKKTPAAAPRRRGAR